MIPGNPKETILVDIDRVLCEAGSDRAYEEARRFLVELNKHGKVYIYSSRKLAMNFIVANDLDDLVEGYVEKPNAMAIIDDKALECKNAMDDYDEIIGRVTERAAQFRKE